MKARIFVSLLTTIFTYSIGHAQSHSGTVENIKTNILIGDISRQPTQGIIVPQFKEGISEGGVGGAIFRAGGEDAMVAAQKMMDNNPDLKNFGRAFVTTSPKMKKSLINVVTVGSGVDNEFSVVKAAVFNGLVAAQKSGITSVSIPALGTGIIGQLSNEQSAKAILSGIAEFKQKGGTMSEINVVIYGDRAQHSDFVKVLDKKSYAGSTASSGQRVIDGARWVSGMTNQGTDIDKTVGQGRIDAENVAAMEVKSTSAPPKGFWQKTFGRLSKGLRGSR